MPLPRRDVVPGYLEELERLEGLVCSVGPAEWASPTRCAGWSVGDVAAHVVGTLTDVAAMKLDRLGDPGYVEQVVLDRRGRGPADIAEELRSSRRAGADLLATIDDAAWAGPALTPVVPTLGDGVLALWYDTYIHLDDIRTATGRPSESGPGLAASLVHLADLLAEQGWGPATLAPDGLEPLPVGGGGRPVEGDPLQLLLVGTGRADPASLGLDETVNVYR